MPEINVTVLHSFTGADGAYPTAGLTRGPDGTLYGTTPIGGASNRGTIFRMAPDGSSYTVLHSFPLDGTDGIFPFGVIQATDGMLYGTTSQGGPNGPGTFFRIALDGTGYTVGTLYGTTIYGGPSDAGVVFQLTFSPSSARTKH